MTNDATKCAYYKAESENIKSRWACVFPRSVLIQNMNTNFIIPNNKQDCEVCTWIDTATELILSFWVVYRACNIDTTKSHIITIYFD